MIARLLLRMRFSLFMPMDGYIWWNSRNIMVWGFICTITACGMSWQLAITSALVWCGLWLRQVNRECRLGTTNYRISQYRSLPGNFKWTSSLNSHRSYRTTAAMCVHSYRLGTAKNETTYFLTKFNEYLKRESQ